MISTQQGEPMGGGVGGEVFLSSAAVDMLNNVVSRALCGVKVGTYVRKQGEYLNLSLAQLKRNYYVEELTSFSFDCLIA